MPSPMSLRRQAVPARPSMTTSAFPTRPASVESKTFLRRQMPTGSSAGCRCVQHLSEEASSTAASQAVKRRLHHRATRKVNLLYLNESTSSLDFGTENTIFDMIQPACRPLDADKCFTRLSTIHGVTSHSGHGYGEIVRRQAPRRAAGKRGRVHRLRALQRAFPR